MITFRHYLDNVNEQLSFNDKATPPPRYVIYTPVLYDAWYDWYELQSDKNMNKGSITALGTTIAPDFVKFEFKNLEEFYQHYTEMTSEVDE